MLSKSKNINNCKSFKKNKIPKCNDQLDCEWVPKIGDKIGYCNQKKNILLKSKLIKQKRKKKII